MWKPPERIRYKSQPGTWPDAATAAASRLFKSIGVGPVTLDTRTWVPAMVPWRASDDGLVTADVLAWYQRFARGEPGGLVVEATGIRDIPSGPLLRIGDDRFVPGLRDLVDTVRQASGGRTRLFIQLIDFLTIRRRPDATRFFMEFLDIAEHHRAALDAAAWSDQEIRQHLAALPSEELADLLTGREKEALEMGYRERVTDMHLDHIARLPAVLPGLFADAAVRARDAGFDGVELHYAHAYTMASFLSALNDRPDGYGGARAQRVRLPLEVYRAVRDAVGESFAVGCRFLSEECIDRGNSLDDSRYFAVRFAEAGFDFLSLSRGGKFEDAKQPGIGQVAYPYTGRSGYECMPAYISDAQGPFGRNVEPAHAIRSDIQEAGFNTPVIAVGGIHGYEQAETIIRNGSADIVGAARQSLADPDWFKKVREGCGAEVRVCEYTNYCEGLDQKHKQVTCQLWDREELERPGTTLSVDGKRRLIAPEWTLNNDPRRSA